MFVKKKVMEEHQERMGKNDNKEINHPSSWLVFNDIFLAEADIMTSKLREKKPINYPKETIILFG